MSLSKWDLGSCNCPGCVVTFCVESCVGLTPLAGLLVEVKSGGVTIGSCTTAVGGGCCSIDVGSAGSYEVVVSGTGIYTYRRTHTLACTGIPVTIPVKRTVDGNAPLLFRVSGCCGHRLEDAEVILNGLSQLTDVNGEASWGVTTAGTYSWSISKARFVTQTGTITLNTCDNGQTITRTLLPATGYVCGPGCGGTSLADPVPTTLFATDSVYGASTWTYNAGTHNWTGTATGPPPTHPAGCPTGDIQVDYTLGQCVFIGNNVIKLDFTCVDSSAFLTEVTETDTEVSCSMGSAIPFSYTITLTVVAGGALEHFYGVGTHTITITE